MEEGAEFGFSKAGKHFTHEVTADMHGTVGFYCVGSIASNLAEGKWFSNHRGDDGSMESTSQTAA